MGFKKGVFGSSPGNQHDVLLIIRGNYYLDNFLIPITKNDIMFCLQ